MAGKTLFAFSLCALLLSAASAPAGQADPGRMARRGADDAMEKAPAAAAPAAQAPQAAGDPKAKALFESKCSACHPLSRPLGKNKDRDGWTKTVTRMQKVNGCDITDPEAKAIVDYLVGVRGPAGN